MEGCNFCYTRQVEASPPTTIQGGDRYKFNVRETWRLGSVVWHQVFRGTSTLPGANRCPSGAQESRRGHPLLLEPRRRQRSSQAEAPGSTGAALFPPSGSRAVEGFRRSQSPAGRFRARGSSRACPGPLLHSSPQLAALLSSSRAIGTIW